MANGKPGRPPSVEGGRREVIAMWASKEEKNAFNELALIFERPLAQLFRLAIREYAIRECAKLAVPVPAYFEPARAGRVKAVDRQLESISGMDRNEIRIAYLTRRKTKYQLAADYNVSIETIEEIGRT
jgi:hypothetical protein